MSTPKRTPRAVQAAMAQIGENLRLWRTLNRQSLDIVAERAGVSVSTLRRLEHGEGATLENLLRVARTVPVMDDVVAATDPWEHDRGRALASQSLAGDSHHTSGASAKGHA